MKAAVRWLVAMFAVLAVVSVFHSGMAWVISRAEAQTVSTAPAIAAEVLVLTTAVEMPRTKGRTAIEIQNTGPQPLFCSFASNVTVGKGRRIEATSGSWALDAKDGVRIWCITSVNQVTTAATWVSELR